MSSFIAVKHLGLAAYVKMCGAPLIKVEGREFIFESEKTTKEWRVEYNNSPCMRHDALVCELRYHLKS